MAASGQAGASVYRCDSATGVEYRDAPCTIGMQHLPVAITIARMEFAMPVPAPPVLIAPQATYSGPHLSTGSAGRRRTCRARVRHRRRAARVRATTGRTCSRARTGGRRRSAQCRQGTCRRSRHSAARSDADVTALAYIGAAITEIAGCSAFWGWASD